MEDSLPLPVESFSYTWLVTLDSPNRSFDSASFIEMDPNRTPSKRFIVRQDFDFKSHSPMTLVHADKLISNGILVPLRTYGSLSSNSTPVSPLSLTTRKVEKRRLSKSRSVSLPKLHKTIVQKYMELVRPLWCRMRRGRSSSRVQEVENSRGCSNVLGSKSTRSGVSWVDYRQRCCDSESSIHEAVVHCKKTIGMV